MSFDNPHPFELVRVNDKKYTVSIKFSDGRRFLMRFILDKKVLATHPRRKVVSAWYLDWYITAPNFQPPRRRRHRDDELRGYTHRYEERVFDNAIRVISVVHNALKEFRDLVNPKFVTFQVVHEDTKSKMVRIYHKIVTRLFIATKYTVTVKEKEDKTEYIIQRHHD
jgi:hypothetical protein